MSKRADRSESTRMTSSGKEEDNNVSSEVKVASTSTTTTHPSSLEDDFYVRYYVGNKSKEYGHEFMEFELSPNGRLRYANNSNYKSDSMIRKEVFISPAVVEEFRRIIVQSEVSKVNDENWEQVMDDEENAAEGGSTSTDTLRRSRRQELEIKIGNEHLAFTCREIESLLDAQKSADPKGLILFYYLAQDLKCLVYTLISAHFKVKPF